ncbi:hypothetical protein Acr_00g0061110 [Actinidia rufa]|uniref:Uncharacterized protein n=1 Tax=Actinidia rufa TaxID=165716 RepID=A0A7J0DNK3_9ERIC|nr:hypothetical protein Acr_00g0061110 [Actinidia rufa]
MYARTFMDKQPHEAYSYFDYLANLTRDWAFIGTQNFEGIKEALHGQVNAIGHYGQGARNPYSNTYSPGWRYHPNFGWRIDGTSNPQAYQGGSLEDTLQQFIQSQGGVNLQVDKTLDVIKSQLTLLTQALTFTEKGKLPTQPQPNPSRHVHSTEISNQPFSGHEQVQAITVLRSGKTIDKTILPIDPKGRGEASKLVKGTIGGDRETGEKKESEGVPREEENKNEKGNDERKEKSGSVPKSEEV